MAAIRYFAYGSNLHQDQMDARCTQCTAIGPAVLPGHRLIFAGESKRWDHGGVANIIRAQGHAVHGFLFELPGPSLEALDTFEGHPNRYRRTPVEVRRDDRNVSAIAYVRVDNPPARRPSPEYLATMAYAYGRLGFAFDSLLEASAATRR